MSKSVDGIGLEGWVEVEEDWKFVCVGNEKLLKSQGGKARVSAKEQEKLDAFIGRNTGAVILYICVDDVLELVLSLAGLSSI